MPARPAPAAARVRRGPVRLITAGPQMGQPRDKAPHVTAGARRTVRVVHTAEFVPPLMAALLYLSCYRFRWIALSPDRRPPRWRVACFASGVVLVAAIQAPPFDTLADTVLVAHAIQHILLGDIASLLIVLGLTGPVLQPLLATRWAR